ncbi:hypothetical protein Nepgr_022535 [Nepenthes gracilis]|uniref:Uncharacterized protein n=1 Tax=Nepenthes gracilis TaxID=150966 RepID=A0AAD3T0Y1_NEPGR|nr:hypothetical protein Nepgr_022535 [Nepenthes gracilis]
MLVPWLCPNLAVGMLLELKMLLKLLMMFLIVNLPVPVSQEENEEEDGVEERGDLDHKLESEANGSDETVVLHHARTFLFSPEIVTIFCMNFLLFMSKIEWNLVIFSSIILIGFYSCPPASLASSF